MNAKCAAAGLFIAAFALSPFATAAPPANAPVEIIGESSGPPPQPVCAGPGCATVLSIRYQGKEWVPVAAEDGPGTYVGASDGILMGPAEAPVFIGDAALDKDENIWTITVELRNGMVETIPQNFPPLFKRGDWVIVDGNSIQLAE